MSIARSILLRASRSPTLADQARRRSFMRRAVRRFMPGEDVSAAVAAAADLAHDGIGTVFTQLGENITSRAEADAVREHYIAVYDQLQARGLTTAISIKLTQLGLDIDPAACEANVRALVARATKHGSCFWIDMEDSSYVDRTLDLYRRLRSEGANVGIAIQAYLRRTPADIDKLLPLAPTVRLVKGAYREAPEIAFPVKRDVDEAYYSIASKLLEHTPGGTKAIFGTHDLDLIARIRGRAKELSASPDGWEVHMLYGIREGAQRRLNAEGVRVRVLISYGSAWFAWYMRRLAERPANVWFVVKSLIS
jgi:proline dehydrogenase